MIRVECVRVEPAFPEAIQVTWELKPVSSAETGMEKTKATMTKLEKTVGQQ
jgi:hypothetical protein